jgi:hypothetical protein
MKQDTFIHQEKYTNDLIKKFNKDELKPMPTLMSTTASLDPDKMVRMWIRGSTGA